VYKAQCLHCDKFYIGCTQQFLNQRMAAHVYSTVSLLRGTPHLIDTFAKHLQAMLNRRLRLRQAQRFFGL
jgi:hypothetical protein